MKKKTDYNRIVVLLFFTAALLFTGNAFSAVTITPAPADNAVNVPLNTAAITAAFSAEMDAATINKQTFPVTIKTEFGNIAVDGEVTYSSKIATFKPAQKMGIDGPTSDLNPNTTYSVTITTGVKESGGTALLSNYEWSFTTGSATTSKVISTSPENNALNVPVITKIITATFSEDIFKIGEGTFIITSEDYDIITGTGILKGTVSYNSTAKTVTFTLTDSLEIETTYYATVTPEKVGIDTKPGYTWSFTTGSALTCVKGDFNCDTQVNMADAITGLQICVGMTPLSSSTADVNADSKIGLEDILYVLRYIAGLVTN